MATPTTPAGDDLVPAYITDPETRAKIAARMSEAREHTVVEPILSFSNDEIPPTSIAHDFDLGVRFAAVRLYDAAIGLRQDADQMALPDWMGRDTFKARALEALIFTVASNPVSFRTETQDNPDEILPNLVGFALSDTYQKILAEHDQMAQMAAGS